jgi:hypothetical protein
MSYAHETHTFKIANNLSNKQVNVPATLWLFSGFSDSTLGRAILILSRRLPQSLHSKCFIIIHVSIIAFFAHHLRTI